MGFNWGAFAGGAADGYRSQERLAMERERSDREAEMFRRETEKYAAGKEAQKYWNDTKDGEYVVDMGDGTVKRFTGPTAKADAEALAGFVDTERGALPRTAPTAIPTGKHNIQGEMGGVKFNLQGVDPQQIAALARQTGETDLGKGVQQWALQRQIESGEVSPTISRASQRALNPRERANRMADILYAGGNEAAGDAWRERGKRMFIEDGMTQLAEVLLGANPDGSPKYSNEQIATNPVVKALTDSKSNPYGIRVERGQLVGYNSETGASTPLTRQQVYQHAIPLLLQHAGDWKGALDVDIKQREMKVKEDKEGGSGWNRDIHQQTVDVARDRNAIAREQANRERWRESKYTLDGEPLLYDQSSSKFRTATGRILTDEESQGVFKNSSIRPLPEVERVKNDNGTSTIVNKATQEPLFVMDSVGKRYPAGTTPEKEAKNHEEALTTRLPDGSTLQYDYARDPTTHKVHAVWVARLGDREVKFASKKEALETARAFFNTGPVREKKQAIPFGQRMRGIHGRDGFSTGADIRQMYEE